MTAHWYPPPKLDLFKQSYELHNLAGPIAKFDGRDIYYIKGCSMDFETWNVHPEVVKYRNELKLKKELGIE